MLGKIALLHKRARPQRSQKLILGNNLVWMQCEVYQQIEGLWAQGDDSALVLERTSYRVKFEACKVNGCSFWHAVHPLRKIAPS